MHEERICINGHEFTDANTGMTPKGQRVCRACKRDEYYRRSRASGQWQGQLPNYARTHCPKGHSYSGENVKLDYRGKRVCVQCSRDWKRERYARTKSKGLGPSSERTHCRHGHEYVGDNLTVNAAGKRECKTCRRASARAKYARDKARKAAK